MPIFRSDLQCEVSEVQYDFDKRSGRLIMAPGQCCHMPACTALFEGIDPKAQRIETFAGELPDTIYRRDGKVWSAMLPR